MSIHSGWLSNDSICEEEEGVWGREVKGKIDIWLTRIGSYYKLDITLELCLGGIEIEGSKIGNGIKKALV